MDLGIEFIERETFLAALELTKDLLRGLGLNEPEVKRVTETFKRFDEKRLYEDYQYYTDLEKVRANAQSQAKELEELFAADIEELPEGDGAKIIALERDARKSAG
jgi:5'-deoxynucleotidase YfbR-like HD superfamily hydrolase